MVSKCQGLVNTAFLDWHSCTRLCKSGANSPIAFYACLVSESVHPIQRNIQFLLTVRSNDACVCVLPRVVTEVLVPGTLAPVAPPPPGVLPPHVRTPLPTGAALRRKISNW